MPKNKGRKGMGVDAHGGPVIDPTINVIALVEAESKRQDDLRLAEGRYHESLRIAQARMFERETRHLEEMAVCRAAHAKDITEKETSRLNAIRQVDQQQISTAAQQTLTAVNTLATTSARDAETLRNALTNTAATIATQTANIVSGLTERIAALEKSSYEGAGKQSYVDPMMTRLLQGMERLSDGSHTIAGKSQGISASWGVLMGTVALIGALLGIAAFFKNDKPDVAVAPLAPQVVYVPAPSASPAPTPPPR